MLGGLFIIICIVLIGAGPAIFDSPTEQEILSEDDLKIINEKKSEQLMNLTYSVICAVIAGMTFSLNTLNVEYCINTVGFPPSQINFDG